MRFLALLAFASVALALVPNAFAYYNITYVNTTVTLNNSTSAHVQEQFTVFVSNSSYSQYNSNRNAVNLSLSHWAQVLYTTQLQENLIGRGHSVYNFEFLPGPLGKKGFTNWNTKVFKETNVRKIAAMASHSGEQRPVIELRGYKVLSNGAIDRAVSVKASAFSKKAIDKIKQAGGETATI